MVGAGVVGAATGRALHRHGHDVFFVDIDPSTVEALRRDGFDAGGTIEFDARPTVVLLAVPTPYRDGGWDLGAVRAAAASIGDALGAAIRASTAPESLVIAVRSTVPPGTTTGLVQPIVADRAGCEPGEDFVAASAPEFLRAATALDDALHPRVSVVAARDGDARRTLAELFSSFGGELEVLDEPSAAEMIKCAHNLYNATKISFWNEMWEVAGRLGVEADTVARVVAASSEASWNPSYGIRGGEAYGGMCLPKDTCGFRAWAASAGYDLPLLSATIEVNDRMSRVGDVIDLRHAHHGVEADDADDSADDADTRGGVVG
ncbi:MAG: UDP-glucose/GDP-mannose dehydrogenase family protein [Actinomycetota bacterium]|nr:UDP-glucose/GDP-mannose dehydrogenase family protein [Actinomycetota bacterium]